MTLTSFLYYVTFFFVLFSSKSLTAMNPSIGDEDGEEIVINPTINPDNQSKNRMPAFIPIEATFYQLQGMVELVFAWPIDDLMVRLTNTTTGDYLTSDVSTGGDVQLPVLFGEGVYLLEFYTENGTIYQGAFNNNY